jgi:NADPH-dependent 2,4-dienoyl-CoA reductase/sulfur reductase-like enzyme/nitrite reductase/ring-hydroxylating ferredoxin subunit
MSEPAKLTGPDFGAGVPMDSVKEGEVLLGHAKGEAVLLSRQGELFSAVAATCTHYGGPLAEGLVQGEEVHCPWHHACFNLRTGEAVRAPGLNALDCYRVEKRAGKVFVREKSTSPTLMPRSGPPSVVIIGGGAAGLAAAETLRLRGYGGPVSLVSAEGTFPVDRPNLSKDYLAGTAEEDWITVRGESFYKEQRIDWVPGRATEIDAKAHQVTLEGGRKLSYGALLLATGGEPIRLPIPGATLPHVHTLRTLADSKAIIAGAKTAKRALVIGASFIGLEVAASLRTRGVPVDVAAPEGKPLERVLGPAFGDFIRAFHEEHGVKFHLGKTVKEIRAGSALLDDGTELPADLVAMGVGVRPSLALAERAGCKIDRGVVVNEFLESSVSGIYAAGDIARYPDRLSGQSIRVEHWVVAERLGQAAARNILGAKAPFRDVPFFWSAHYDVSINYVGHAEKWDRIEVVGSIPGKDCIAAYFDGERIAAFASIFRDKESLLAESKLETGNAAAVLAWWKSLPR